MNLIVDSVNMQWLWKGCLLNEYGIVFVDWYLFDRVDFEYDGMVWMVLCYGMVNGMNLSMVWNSEWYEFEYGMNEYGLVLWSGESYEFDCVYCLEWCLLKLKQIKYANDNLS